MTVVAADARTCCAEAYGSEAAHFLLGDSFHPGGARLTRRLLGALDVSPAGTILDLAAGAGATAILAASETGCRVVGVDIAHGALRSANARARALASARRPCFVGGDAGRRRSRSRS